MYQYPTQQLSQTSPTLLCAENTNDDPFTNLLYYHSQLFNFVKLCMLAPETFCLIFQECKLWEIARGSADEPLQSFYVRELEPYIEVKEATIGNLLKKLSQIPGRLNTTALNSLDEVTTTIKGTSFCHFPQYILSLG